MFVCSSCFISFAGVVVGGIVLDGVCFFVVFVVVVVVVVCNVVCGIVLPVVVVVVVVVVVGSFVDVCGSTVVVLASVSIVGDDVTGVVIGGVVGGVAGIGVRRRGVM